MNFKEFVDQQLSEAIQPSTLIHMMDVEKALDVFQNDTMEAKWRHYIPRMQQYVLGNSFSRSPTGYLRSVKLEVYREKINRHNKIIPIDGERIFRTTHRYSPQDINFVDRVMNRRSGQLTEEFVIGDIHNIHSCISKITLYRHGIRTTHSAVELRDTAMVYCEKHNIPLFFDPEYEKWIEDILQRWDEED